MDHGMGLKPETAQLQKRKNPADVNLRGFSMYGGEIGI